MEISEIVKNLSKPLPIEQIDWRVQSIKKTKSGKVGMIVLGYKDSRVDMQRLDETCLGSWQNVYQRDSKGVLQCGISVYGEMSDGSFQWVTKYSNGVESFAEKAKGEYSDSFKRAGFMWGIGRELYNLPFIWIDLDDDEYYEYKGSLRNSLNPNDLTWTNEGGLLTATDSKGNVRFKERKTQNTQAKTQVEPSKGATPKAKTSSDGKPLTDAIVNNIKKAKGEGKTFEEVIKILESKGFEKMEESEFEKL